MRQWFVAFCNFELISPFAAEAHIITHSLSLALYLRRASMSTRACILGISKRDSTIRFIYSFTRKMWHVRRANQTSKQWNANVEASTRARIFKCRVTIKIRIRCYTINSLITWSITKISTKDKHWTRRTAIPLITFHLLARASARTRAATGGSRACVSVCACQCEFQSFVEQTSDWGGIDVASECDCVTK